MSSRNLTEMLWEELARPVRRARAKGLITGKPHWSDLDRGELLAQAVEASPDRLQSWHRLVDYWLEKGSFLQAASVLDRMIARFPDISSLYAMRAEALARIDPERSDRDEATARLLGEPPRPEPLSVTIAAPAPDDDVATIYAEMTDMMEYLTLNASMSGIQRVVANMLRCAMDRTSPNARDVRPVIPDYLNNVIYAADPVLVRELIDEVELRSPTRERLDRLLDAIHSTLRAIEIEPGSVFLMAGAFWIVKSYDLLRTLRQKGVVVTVFVHDLIQIDNPEYVDEKATHAFRRSLLDVGEIANFFTTNSAFVARELRRFLVNEMDLRTPVYPVPLATEMALSRPEPWAEESLRAEFGEAGYVLCVSTIEIRKNHVYLVNIWQELMRTGRTDLPKLVFVGKWGWEIDHLQDLLHRTNSLNGMVKVLNSVSDSMLASLYRNSRFTIYPSFAEGWGLPIGESLVLGKPCISAGVTSMPEVGGKLVRYVDPVDVATGLAAVTQLLDDPADLAAWTKQVETDFKPRTWTEFAEELLGASRALGKTAAAMPAAFARIRPGELAIVGNNAVRKAAAAGGSMRTARMARDRGWWHLEDSGVWSISPLASIRFIAAGCSPGDRVRVVIGLRGEAGFPLGACQLRSNVELTPYRDLETAASPHGVEAVVDQDGVIEISLLVRGVTVTLRGKNVYANLSSVGYYHRDDAEEAFALMEATTFQP